MTQSNNPELSARIETALAALPPQQRAVFLALRDEGISYADLAQRLGGRKDEVEQTFVEALIALDRALDVPTSPCLATAILRRIAHALGLSQPRDGR